LFAERQRPKTTAEELRSLIEKVNEREVKKEAEREKRHRERMSELTRFVDIFAAVNNYHKEE